MAPPFRSLVSFPAKIVYPPLTMPSPRSTRAVHCSDDSSLEVPLQRDRRALKVRGRLERRLVLSFFILPSSSPGIVCTVGTVHVATASTLLPPWDFSRGVLLLATYFSWSSPIRGGSWLPAHDMFTCRPGRPSPSRCRTASALAYPIWKPVPAASVRGSGARQDERGRSSSAPKTFRHPLSLCIDQSSLCLERCGAENSGERPEAAPPCSPPRPPRLPLSILFGSVWLQVWEELEKGMIRL
ncbi:hypothetical protein B0T16DRAFT_46912 [Cercophora newfieldiana]|uniref:Uncharacterized protein n=1 Tax=Cercophora newfieldiana TaxID=92897 RepID=A0AA39YQK7_9PEZI|nr:hypothetical protein B0T16DRAFT_46912 [Cercophora newfieldiana]